MLGNILWKAICKKIFDYCTHRINLTFVYFCSLDCFSKVLFSLFQTYIFMFKNITLAVPGSVITGVVCILVLIALKYISEKLKHRMKFPIPAELIVVSD